MSSTCHLQGLPYWVIDYKVIPRICNEVSYIIVSFFDLMASSDFNEYLLYGRRLKNGKFFQRSKIFFNAKNQREFTLVTSEASFLSKFKLIFGIIKEFCWVKKFHFESVFHTTCSFLQHLSALWNFVECF